MPTILLLYKNNMHLFDFRPILSNIFFSPFVSKDVKFIDDQPRLMCDHLNDGSINYPDKLAQLQQKFSTPCTYQQKLEDLFELTQHFPYIMSEPKEVRAQLWDFLSENTDKVFQQGLSYIGDNYKNYEILQENRSILWSNIANYLEFLISDNNCHPLFDQINKEEERILNHIEKIITSEKLTKHHPQAGVLNIEKLVTLTQSLNYLERIDYFSRFNFQQPKKIISKFISENFAHFEKYHLDRLIKCLNTTTDRAQSKPWALALHAYRTCLFIQKFIPNINETLKIAIAEKQSNIASVLIQEYESIPKHLFSSCFKEIIGAQSHIIENFIQEKPEREKSEYLDKLISRLNSECQTYLQHFIGNSEQNLLNMITFASYSEAVPRIPCLSLAFRG